MSDPKLKITFPNKEDSWILNQNSKYVLTAANVNEIKEVVNNISNAISGLNMFSDIYKYSRFIVPDSLKSQCNYELQLEISTGEDFSDAVVITSTANTNLFNIFENGIWKNLIDINKSSFNSNDANKSVYVEIKNYIDRPNSYYGRYRWKNLMTNTCTDYFGFILGAFDYSDVNVDDRQNEIVSFYVMGNESAFEKTTNSYQLKGRKRNGTVIDVTTSATFTSSDLSATINGSSIKFAKSHIEHVESIKAEIEYENEVYDSYLNVVVHPSRLESLELLSSSNFSKMQSNIAKTLNVIAKYSNGDSIDVTSECTIDSSFDSWTYDSATHNFSISGNEEEMGSLEISYNDPDYPEIETTILTKYIKLQPDDIISLTTNIPSSINFNGQNSSYNVNYQITGNRRFTGNTNLTSTSIISVVNGNGVSFSNGIMTINPEELKSGQNISLLISNPSTSLKLERTINVIGDSLEDLIIKINNATSGFETFDSTSNIPFEVYAVIGGSQTRLTSGYEFKCISSNKVTISNGKINVGKFDSDEYVTFAANYKLRGKSMQKYVTILVKANSILKISVTGDFNAIEGALKTYSVIANYSDGTTGDVTNSSAISLACGIPSNVTITNDNPIQIRFNSINAASVNMAFVAEELQSGKTKTFTVNVAKN